MFARSAADRVRRRYGYMMVTANLAGAVVVFVFLAFVLPSTGTVKHPGTVLLINVITFAVYGAVAFPLGWTRSARRSGSGSAWLDCGPAPPDAARAPVLAQ